MLQLDPACQDVGSSVLRLHPTGYNLNYRIGKPLITNALSGVMHKQRATLNVSKTIGCNPHQSLRLEDCTLSPPSRSYSVSGLDQQPTFDQRPQQKGAEKLETPPADDHCWLPLEKALFIHLEVETRV